MSEPMRFVYVVLSGLGNAAGPDVDVFTDRAAAEEHARRRGVDPDHGGPFVSEEGVHAATWLDEPEDEDDESADLTLPVGGTADHPKGFVGRSQPDGDWYYAHHGERGKPAPTSPAFSTYAEAVAWLDAQ